jgi:hypothetical protein
MHGMEHGSGLGQGRQQLAKCRLRSKQGLHACEGMLPQAKPLTVQHFFMGTRLGTVHTAKPPSTPYTMHKRAW